MIFYFIDRFIGLLSSQIYLFIEFELWILIKLIDDSLLAVSPHMRSVKRVNTVKRRVLRYLKTIGQQVGRF